MKKRWIFTSISAILILGILLAGWIGTMIVRDSSSDILTGQKNIDYVVILGCKLDDDKPGRILQARIDSALELLKSHPEAKAICTGGQGKDEPVSEADAAEQVLLESGISSDRILKETSSKNTYENFQYAKELIKPTKDGKEPQIAIVTSEFHLHRSCKMAELHGIQNPIKVASKTPVLDYLPHLIREIAAVAVIDFRY